MRLDFTSHTPATPSVRNVVKLPMTLPDGKQLRGELISFSGLSDQREHFAVRFSGGSLADPLLRLHSECVTGDVLGSRRCDCGSQLHEALRMLDECGGYLLYLRQEGRGLGLYRKIDAYRLQEQGSDTFEANRILGYADDERSYAVAVEMLEALGLRAVRLLSNNPDKAQQLEQAGIRVTERIPTGVFMNDCNRGYIEAKVRKGGHTMHL
ncbi:GTP cyclohydrolase II [Roseateles sp. SL47]|nr:GTP cyclohydrolase II [Roseateles sp. SL47]WAC73513.1 GTP cyclohydrolase II [Roseateles sp. SL47]